jgi:dTDP-4-amino-4,6-dideoxygalactose transaminase
MKKIQMVDLKGQYDQIQEQVNQSVLNIIASTQFINGPQVKDFQEHLESYLNVKHVIPCANGTDALQIALMGLGLKPGDEVITADFTFAATVEVISLLGLTPVLVDVDPATFNIDLESVEKVISPKSKAIIPVHLFGQAADMEGIMALAEKHNLYVVEDNAQSIGADYTFNDGSKKRTGTIGDIGTTSFFPSKNLGAYGDGGAIFTNNDELAHTIRGMVNHGMYVRYHHDVVGVNSRLDSVQAAILDNESRKAAALKYNQRLKDHPNLIIPYRKGDCDSHVYHQYTLRVIDADRDGLVQHLNNNNIPCGIYYPIPLHQQKAYTSERYKAEDFKVTLQIVNEVISLPMHTELSDDQIDFITDTIKEFLGQTLAV